MNKRPLLVLCRHGRTALNKESAQAGESGERIRAWQDIPLTAEGREDARDLAADIVKQRYDVDRVFSSDLSRAADTAEVIAEHYGVPVEETRALRPWSLGYLSGRPVSEALPVMANFVDNESRKVPGGESFEQFRIRCLTFIRRLIAAAHRDNHVIVAVAHTRNSQLVRAWIANGHPEDMTIDRKTFDSYKQEVKPGGFIEIDVGDIIGGEFKADSGESNDTDE